MNGNNNVYSSGANIYASSGAAGPYDRVFSPDQALREVEGTARARRVLGADLTPSPQLQSQVKAAAERDEVEARWEARVEDTAGAENVVGTRRWHAIIRTARGLVSVNLVPDPRAMHSDPGQQEYVDGLWVAAFREAGLDI